MKGPSSRTGVAEDAASAAAAVRQASGRTATIFRWTRRSPQELAPRRGARNRVHPIRLPRRLRACPSAGLDGCRQVASDFENCQSLYADEAMDYFGAPLHPRRLRRPLPPTGLCACRSTHGTDHPRWLQPGEIQWRPRRQANHPGLAHDRDPVCRPRQQPRVDSARSPVSLARPDHRGPPRRDNRIAFICKFRILGTCRNDS